MIAKINTSWQLVDWCMLLYAVYSGEVGRLPAQQQMCGRPALAQRLQAPGIYPSRPGRTPRLRCFASRPQSALQVSLLRESSVSGENCVLPQDTSSMLCPCLH